MSSPVLRAGLLCLVVSVTLVLAPMALAQKAVLSEAEVVGNDVYVRSGPSLNHYTICKLQAGTRLKVVGERGEWREILPPKDTFSLISGDYVDVAGQGAAMGVVNGNNVRVRAGSSLNDNKYTVQTKLSKGDRVTVLGRNPDGFLRIVPPSTATLWIHQDFVAPATGRAPVPRGKTPKRADQPTQPVGDDPTQAEVETMASTELSPHQVALEAIDEDVRAELAKPIIARNLRPFIERYEVYVDQDNDEIAKRYAKTRVDQLSGMSRLIEAVKNVRLLAERAEATRRKFSMERIHPVEPPARAGLDAKGVLRPSALYPPTSLPRRFRLAESDAANARTIGYVEIPQSASINIDQFLGRFVGVRAVSTSLQKGGVKPVPIYVTSELVLLQPEEMETAAQQDQKG